MSKVAWMSEHALDWRPNPDPRSAMWTVSLADCYDRSADRLNIMRRKTVFLDQGREGACTGFGAEHVRALSPYPVQTSNSEAQRVYYEARKQDEWEGEDYEGSSVNGAMKALRLQGKITEWRWCWTLPEVRHALAYHGAVEIGVWWYSGMWDADGRGFIHVTGTKVGGHALALSGYSRRPEGTMYRLENSWGPDWGDNGGAWISEFDLLQLLNDDGEFACPKKARL